MAESRRRYSQNLINKLKELGDNYGPLGVALAAARLTDPYVLIGKMHDEGMLEDD